jgi:hypothetical protein
LPNREASPFAHALPVIPTANAQAVSNINFFVTVSSDRLFLDKIAPRDLVPRRVQSCS